MTKTRSLLLIPLVLAGAAGCMLLDTGNSESVRGRGSKAFDPYSLESGAVRLSLQYFNGCAVLPTGESLSKGSLKIPYPDVCRSLVSLNVDAGVPTGKLELTTGTNYFLNQLTLLAVEDVRADGGFWNNANVVAGWMKHDSAFKDLDWSNLGVTRTEWFKSFNGNAEARREISYGGANWMNVKDDSFLVEVLDADNNVRSSATYLHNEFLGEGPGRRHTMLKWRAIAINRPTFPNDPKFVPSYRADQARYEYIAKYEQFGSTNPFKTVSTEGLLGEGSVRVTWSQLPNQPYYFPVTFVKKEDRPKTCFGGPNFDQPVACEFGLVPDIAFSTPKNGKFYEPGETYNAFLALKDGAGNLLHPKDGFPSWDDLHTHKANGILYGTSARTYLYEGDEESCYQIAGPIQDLYKLSTDTLGLSDYFKYNYAPKVIAEQVAEHGEISANDITQKWPTRIGGTIPLNAKPGTYVASLVGFRQYQGERIGRTGFFFFQVGQEKATQYPNRVGNCQICHRGTISLENLGHGASVDNIEYCKTCHDQGTDIGALVHNIHSRSNKYPRAPNDCSACHLTRESATRPSIDICETCHPAVHGNAYFEASLTVAGTPNRFTTCAQTCHVDHAPTQHILPNN